MNRIELVLVLLFTFFVIVVWITSDVILVKPNTPEDPKIQAMLEPLSPTFDTKTIEQISSTKLDAPIRQVPTPAPANITPLPKESTTSASTNFGNNANTASTPLITAPLIGEPSQ